MAYNKDIVERLSQFNNISFTKKQWDIILKGCGCPKSSHFWAALKQTNLVKCSRLFTLININDDSFHIIWENYCYSNRAGAKKAYNKAKVIKQIEKRTKSFRGITFYMIGGALTTEKPERDL